MNKCITFFVLLLGIASLFLEWGSTHTAHVYVITNIMDFVIVFLSLGQLFVEIKKSKHPIIYLKRNAFSIVFLAFFVILFSISKVLQFLGTDVVIIHITGIIVLRNLFILLKIFTRFQKISVFFHNIVNHPAQTIVFSFAMVILTGTLLLVMPFASATGEPISLLDSFFTATSAVCVTGLVVFDTGVQFSFVGQIIILVLIQIGGLSIMLLSFSVIFLFKRSLSLENKLLVSYIVDEEDLGKIKGMALRIILSTFFIEACGAVILFFTMRTPGRSLLFRMYNAVFHAISAFCNAGFSLNGDSLCNLGNSFSLLTIGGLIIFGGIGFSTIFDTRSWIKKKIQTLRGKGKQKTMDTNTVLVLQYTAFLLLAGTLLIYFTEHANTLLPKKVGSQYLHAFFQSITLRTAGFNSIPFDKLATSTLVIMLPFMFIGGASGSAAGGIKVNTIGVIIAYFRAYLKKNDDTIIKDARVEHRVVVHSFLLFFIAICIICFSAFILSLTENQPYIAVLFETVSAFATVGVSTGITASLSFVGKVIIICLMFFGRLGPLTILAAAASGKKKLGYRYPRADIHIG
ncbi:MAG TPA: potassium transporter TrkG [Treponemataceae bacterium]|nr:potassium transporter TrkG [Treponemataceae bacterium]